MQFRHRAAVVALLSAVACTQASTAFAAAHTAPRHHTTHRVRHHEHHTHHRTDHRGHRTDHTHHRTAHHSAIKLPADYAAWSRVASCEAGGWQVLGAAYPDSLGITRTNFEDYGGAPQPVGQASRAEIIAQIHAADRLIHSYGVGIPDQDGCAAW